MVRDFTHDSPGTPASSWRALADSTEELAVDPPPTRVVVAAAHPDDESLGAGGLLARLHREGRAVELVLATAGEGSHPRSTTTPPERLAEIRLAEVEDALALLAGPEAALTFLGLPDGGLAAHEEELTLALVELLGDGRDTWLVAPWRGDGHPDHEALGRAASRAASRSGARLLAYPIWFWHRADPDGPVPDLRRLPLSPLDREAKRDAVATHRTQVAALSDQPGDEVLLGPGLLEHFAGPDELFVVEPPTDGALDHLHARAADPWGADSRWYERRKRQLTLATLPRRQFASGLEVGCSTGALAAELAGRCRRLLAVDSSEHAVAAARWRLARRTQVDVRHLDLPREWPPGTFDLVVVSEVGYFLTPAGLDELIERIASSLTDDGVVLLCHWRHPVLGWPLSGPDVHARFRAATELPPVSAAYADRDVEILLLCAPDQLPPPAASSGSPE